MAGTRTSPPSTALDESVMYPYPASSSSMMEGLNTRDNCQPHGSSRRHTLSQPILIAPTITAAAAACSNVSTTLPRTISTRMILDDQQSKTSSSRMVKTSTSLPPAAPHFGSLPEPRRELSPMPRIALPPSQETIEPLLDRMETTTFSISPPSNYRSLRHSYSTSHGFRSPETHRWATEGQEEGLTLSSSLTAMSVLRQHPHHQSSSGIMPRRHIHPPIVTHEEALDDERNFDEPMEEIFELEFEK